MIEASKLERTTKECILSSKLHRTHKTVISSDRSTINNRLYHHVWCISMLRHRTTTLAILTLWCKQCPSTISSINTSSSRSIRWCTKTNNSNAAYAAAGTLSVKISVMLPWKGIRSGRLRFSPQRWHRPSKSKKRRSSLTQSESPQHRSKTSLTPRRSSPRRAKNRQTISCLRSLHASNLPQHHPQKSSFSKAYLSMISLNARRSSRSKSQ